VTAAQNSVFPRFQAVADHAVLVEFGETIGAEAHEQVLNLDAALSRSPFPGFTEAVPAYVSILIGFDPLVTDHGAVQSAVAALLATAERAARATSTRKVLVCYDGDFAPELPAVAAQVGAPVEAVIAAHLSGAYSVFMYGFAPGYAYLAGVPKLIQVPRKPAATRGAAVGSVLIAGPQCLVTTLTMPTGWWIIGRSPTRILNDGGDRPFLFDVGDLVTFRRISGAEFDAVAGG
jgi:inhibitor of KinA